jgi:hypothetical protein
MASLEGSSGPCLVLAPPSIPSPTGKPLETTPGPSRPSLPPFLPPSLLNTKLLAMWAWHPITPASTELRKNLQRAPHTQGGAGPGLGVRLISPSLNVSCGPSVELAGAL